MHRNYKIIVTLGPASVGPAMWEDLIQAGASGVRLNTSHLSIDELSGWLDQLNRFFKSYAGPIPVSLDLQGSKWRLGKFEPFELVAGREVTLVLSDLIAQRDILPVPHADFFTAASGSNGEIVLNDAKTRLQILSSSLDRVKAMVIIGGPISPNKGITYTASSYRQETLSKKDRSIIGATRQLSFVQYALSYVRDAQELKNFCASIEEERAGGHFLIAKLERQPAVSQALELGALVDEIWLCRGDLGAELGIQGMAAASYEFAKDVNRLPVPAILAGQVLEHMTEHPTATRSEICAMYDALEHGYQGVVLSDETAIGRFPLQSCRTAALFRGDIQQSE